MTQRFADKAPAKRETMRLHVEYLDLHNCYGILAGNHALVALMAAGGPNKRAEQIAVKLCNLWNVIESKPA